MSTTTDVRDQPGTLADLCDHLARTPRERLRTGAADALLGLADDPAPAGGAERLLAHLAGAMSPDPVRLAAAVERWREAPTAENAAHLNAASEPPRQAVIRAMATATDGPFRLVRLRGRLMELLPERPELGVVDADFLHLFRSWFTPAFLQLREVSWSSSGQLLEEVAAHESVHPVRGWADLRSRLEPADRTCFALVHPAMGERPLVFVEVALGAGLQTDLDFLERRSDSADPRPAPADVDEHAATFYSINTTYAGLRGIPLGHDLLKQAVTHLRTARGVRTFGTLSPVPGFRAWVESRAGTDPATTATLAEVAEVLAAPAAAHPAPDLAGRLERLARTYLAETVDGRPRDRVARFHLGNGARLTGVHWPAGRAPHLLEQSFGLMVNYLYDEPQEAS